jgi:hypothetical protein
MPDEATTSAPVRICANCAHVKRTPVVGSFMCQRYPPHVVGINQHGSPVSALPPVDGRGTCGEYRAEDRT